MRFVDDSSFDKAKQYYQVECEHTTYRSNTLSQALAMWHAAWMFSGYIKVFDALSVAKIG